MFKSLIPPCFHAIHLYAVCIGGLTVGVTLLPDINILWCRKFRQAPRFPVPRLGHLNITLLAKHHCVVHLN